MAWLNLFLLMLEFLTLSVCQYEFLSHNERMIYLKKGWYFLLFFVDYAALFAATALTGADGRIPAAVGNLLSILVIIFGVPVTVSYTHSPSPRDRSVSRMPSSA